MRNVIKHAKEVSDLLSKMECLGIGGEIADTLFHGIELHLDTATRSILDKDLVMWFIYENDFGKNGLAACSSSGEMYPIRDADDLIKLLEG